MLEPTRWTAALSVTWSPILTFARRRMQYLDWLDSNVDVVAFLDDDETLGVAVGRRTQRLVVTSEGATILLEEPQATVKDLVPSLEALLQIMSPVDARIDEYSGAWSVGIEGEYEVQTSRLAARAFGGSQAESLQGPTDCAYLVDLVRPAAEAKIEFGLVSAEELRERLERRWGRVPGRRPVTPSPPNEAELPDLSLFTDTWWMPTEPHERLDSGSLERTLTNTEIEITQLVRDLASTL